MYTQALNSSEGDDRTVEDAGRLAQFQARIDAEDASNPTTGCRKPIAAH